MLCVQPAFEKLVVQTRGRLRYPIDWGTWSREEHMDFRRQRTDMSDMLEDAAGVVGFPRCLSLLLQPLHQLSADVASGQPFDWRAAEAALFCVRSIAFHAADVTDLQVRGRSVSADAPAVMWMELTATRLVCLLCSVLCVLCVNTALALTRPCTPLAWSPRTLTSCGLVST